MQKNGKKWNALNIKPKKKIYTHRKKFINKKNTSKWSLILLSSATFKISCFRTKIFRARFLTAGSGNGFQFGFQCFNSNLISFFFEIFKKVSKRLVSKIWRRGPTLQKIKVICLIKWPSKMLQNSKIYQVFLILSYFTFLQATFGFCMYLFKKFDLCKNFLFLRSTERTNIFVITFFYTDILTRIVNNMHSFLGLKRVLKTIALV